MDESKMCKYCHKSPRLLSWHLRLCLSRPSDVAEPEQSFDQPCTDDRSNLMELDNSSHNENHRSSSQFEDSDFSLKDLQHPTEDIMEDFLDDGASRQSDDSNDDTNTNKINDILFGETKEIATDLKDKFDSQFEISNVTQTISAHKELPSNIKEDVESTDDSQLALAFMPPEDTSLLSISITYPDSSNKKKRVKNYRCRQCDTFISYSRKESHADSIKNHFFTEHNSIICLCPECLNGFNSPTELERHRATHMGEKSHACHLCTKHFAKEMYLVQHLVRVHKQERKIKMPKHRCHDCQEAYTRLEDLEKHQRMNQHFSGTSKHVCKICGQSFHFLRAFKSHVECHEKRNHCPTCKKRFVKEDDLRKHQEEAKHRHTKKNFACTMCPQKYGDRNLLTKHLYKVHSIGESPTVQCQLCGKVVTDHKRLRVHIKEVHEQKKRFQCQFCPMKFYRRTPLEMHELVHKGIKPHSCNICQKKFTREAELKLHYLKKHAAEEEKAFECSHCEKRFGTKRILTDHVVIMHSDEKPFACTECDYRCKLKQNLKMHMRKHTEDRPYTCNVCNKGFKYLGAFKAHKLIHTGEKSFTCSFCGQKFRHKQAMQIHERNHTK